MFFSSVPSMRGALFKVFVVFAMVYGMQQVMARPNHRIKRVSDSHLADLETKIALNNKIKGFAITMPVGAGRIDPIRIGRKRRSDAKLFDVLFNEAEDDRGDPRSLDFDDVWYNVPYLH